MDKEIAKAYFLEIVDSLNIIQEDLMARVQSFPECDPTVYGLIESISMSKAVAQACAEECDATTH